jgi:hypothetical protein
MEPPYLLNYHCLENTPPTYKPKSC